jgi:hypothetical protein
MFRSTANSLEFVALQPTGARLTQLNPGIHEQMWCFFWLTPVLQTEQTNFFLVVCVTSIADIWNQGNAFPMLRARIIYSVQIDYIAELVVPVVYCLLSNSDTCS